MVKINDKNIKKAVHMLRVILKYVLPDVLVVKIRISLFCIFSTITPSKMRKCL